MTLLSNHDANLTSILYYDWKQCGAKRDSLTVQNKILQQIVQKHADIQVLYDTLEQKCFNDLFVLNTKWSVERTGRLKNQEQNKVFRKYLTASLGLNAVLIAGIYFIIR